MVTEEEGREAAESHNIAMYYETSAKTNEGIDGAAPCKYPPTAALFDVPLLSSSHIFSVSARCARNCCSGRSCKRCVDASAAR